MRKLEFYTDGSWSSKSEMGGWAAICLEDDMIIDEQTGVEPYSTNNRMELTALLSALENTNTIETMNTQVTIYIDSAYVCNALNQGWYLTWLKNGWKTADKQDVKNQDLWLRIVPLYIKLRTKVNLEIIKVAAHKKVKWNNYVDVLAVKARKTLED